MVSLMSLGGRTKGPSPGASPCSANATEASNASATGAAIIKSLERHGDLLSYW